MSKRRNLAMGLSLLAGAAFGGSISSLSTTCYFDNHETPPARVVSAEESVEIPIVGDWFASGACDLYVDGVLVAQSAGPLATYALAGAGDHYASYVLELRSAEGVQKKVVTFYPTADYKCLVHALTQSNQFLDAQPAGTVRKIQRRETTSVTWSGLWNGAADRVVVTLYKGSGTAGECLGELVNVEAREEGAYALYPKGLALDVGRYTLTHFDGVETLTAEIRVKDRSGMLIYIR